MYVADGYAVVHRFDARGQRIATWGGPGSGPGRFTVPHAIAVDGRDRILVADRENDRIQVFDRDGTFITA